MKIAGKTLMEEELVEQFMLASLATNKTDSCAILYAKMASMELVLYVGNIVPQASQILE